MNKKSEIRKKLVELFARVLNVKPEEINESFSQNTRSEWDSLNHLLLLTEVERVFKISIPITEASKITTFKKMEKIINETI